MSESNSLIHNCTNKAINSSEEDQTINCAHFDASVIQTANHNNSEAHPCSTCVQKQQDHIELPEAAMDVESDSEEKKEILSTKAHTSSNGAGSTNESLTNLEEFEDLTASTTDSRSSLQTTDSQSATLCATINQQKPIVTSLAFQQTLLSIVGKICGLFESKKDSLRSSLSSITEIEAKLFIARSMGFCVALFCFAAILFWKSDNVIVPYSDLLKLSYAYLAYQIFENVIRLQCTQRDAWRRVEDAFESLDAISGILYLICITQKDLSPVLKVLISTLILLSMNILYPLLSQAPKMVKIARTSQKGYYTLQGFVFVLQFTGLINADWRNVLTPTWCYLTGTLVFTALLGLLVGLFHSYHFVKATIWRDYNDLKICFEEIVSATWYFIYACFSAVIFLGMFGVCQRLEGYAELNSITISGVLGLVLPSIMVLITLFAFKILVICTPVYGGTQLFEELTNPIDDLPEQPSVQITLTTETKEVFFAQCSETYFMTLDAEKTQKAKEVLANSSKISLGRLSSWMNQKDSMTESLLSPSVESHCCPNDLTDNVCYVCCEEKADTVLADCKHGGICYGCAKMLIKKKPECMECRSAVSGIFQLDQKAVISNIYKSKKYSKVVKTEQQRRFI